MRLRTAAWASLAAAPLAAIGIAAPAALPALAGLAAAYTLLGTYYGLVYAAIQDVVPATLRATAMAVYFVAMYLCGASFGPLVTGRLSDLAARYAAGGGPLTDAARATGLHYAMYVIPVFALALAGVLWAGAAKAPRAADERP
jgi:MFS family permease